MALPCTVLSDKWWAMIDPILPKQDTARGGRPRCDARLVLEGILWVLVGGAQWRLLPKEYPSRSTCHRWLKRWQEEGVWEKIQHALLGRLDKRRRLKWSQCFADATFAPAKKGAVKSAQPARAKGQR